MKRLLLLLAIMFGTVIAVGAPASALDSGGSVKVDVCHVDDEGMYNLINVSEKAVPAHLGHGDALPVMGACPGEPVPTPVFSAEVTEATATCVAVGPEWTYEIEWVVNSVPAAPSTFVWAGPGIPGGDLAIGVSRTFNGSASGPADPVALPWDVVDNANPEVEQASGVLRELVRRPSGCTG